jgi:NTP pyrophosphatase (non-canonical NTP hydrolase)
MTEHENTPSLEELTRRLIEFRDARDWRQFHTLKNLLLSLALEAAEALELAQWKTDAELDDRLAADATLKARLEEECADVLLYLLLIAEKAGIDLAAAAARKIELNARKYPVEKAKGRADKYHEL